MALRADELIDRRRLRRKLTFWRVAAVLIAVLVIGGIAAWMAREGVGGIAQDHIARIKIEGTIIEDEELLKRLKDIGESAAVKGVIVTIDSPGGTSVGGEAIFDAVRKLASQKPVVAQIGTLAASAGYMVASATDHIVARQSSIVGSIGVLIQFPDFSGLMDKLGIKMEGVKSSPLKAEPSPFNPTTEEERAMLRALILDTYDWFVDLVDERRPLDRAQVLALADGSIFSGRQALDRKLIDALGGEDVAKEWLGTQGVDTGLEVVEWKPRGGSGGWFLLGSLAGTIAHALGLPTDADLLKEIGADRIFLDGLLSLWHPEKAALTER